MQFVVIQKLIGFVMQFTNIVNYVVLHQLERVPVVLVKDTDIHKLREAHVEQHGNARIVYNYVESVKYNKINIFILIILKIEMKMN